MPFIVRVFFTAITIYIAILLRIMIIFTTFACLKTKKMRKAPYASLGAVCLLVASMCACGGKGAKYTEQTEAETASVEAAMMQGRESARKFVNTRWNDSIELMSALLEAKSVQSKYLLDNKEAEAAAFDSAFIGEIRAVNPQLATAITSDK